MKKLFISAFVALAAYGVYASYTESQAKKVSDLTIANIEALSGDNEQGSGKICKWETVFNANGVKKDVCAEDGTGFVCECGSVQYY